MDDNLWTRVKQEIGHWRRRKWSLAEVGAHWDATEEYDEVNEQTYSYFRRFTDGLRLSNINPGARVLDVCARTGNGTAYFYENGKVGSAICADVSPKMGEICIQRLHESGLRQFIWLPLQDYVLPLASGSIDAVLCFETVEHFSEPDRLIQELGRVTHPGSELILTTPNVLWEPVHALAAVTGYHHSEGPHRFIPYKQLLDMVRSAGFWIEKIETTVLVPGGPPVLVRMGEWIEARTRKTIMHVFGLRRIIIGKKR